MSYLLSKYNYEHALALSSLLCSTAAHLMETGTSFPPFSISIITADSEPSIQAQIPGRGDNNLCGYQNCCQPKIMKPSFSLAKSAFVPAPVTQFITITTDRKENRRLRGDQLILWLTYTFFTKTVLSDTLESSKSNYEKFAAKEQINYVD